MFEFVGFGVVTSGGRIVDQSVDVGHVFAIKGIASATLLKPTHKETANPISNIFAEDAQLDIK